MDFHEVPFCFFFVKCGGREILAVFFFGRSLTVWSPLRSMGDCSDVPKVGPFCDWA